MEVCTDVCVPRHTERRHIGAVLSWVIFYLPKHFKLGDLFNNADLGTQKHRETLLGYGCGFECYAYVRKTLGERRCERTL